MCNIVSFSRSEKETKNVDFRRLEKVHYECIIALERAV